MRMDDLCLTMEAKTLSKQCYLGNEKAFWDLVNTTAFLLLLLQFQQIPLIINPLFVSFTYDKNLLPEIGSDTDVVYS